MQHSQIGSVHAPCRCSTRQRRSSCGISRPLVEALDLPQAGHQIRNPTQPTAAGPATPAVTEWVFETPDNLSSDLQCLFLLHSHTARSSGTFFGTSVYHPIAGLAVRPRASALLRLHDASYLFEGALVPHALLRRATVLPGRKPVLPSQGLMGRRRRAESGRRQRIQNQE
ncbi:hypothetical protein MPH_02055 [Macrophomina phaseolina MS6]|uniref:Uncharacterized protein n=1 Tax=Macrophomina phaseolina (strain MS6) TaxID=1126212 RepID=K2S0P6_MACPH|nr:hypothetical protein MPH_02055 [Macrophomina phaseolina MS6]